MYTIIEYGIKLRDRIDRFCSIYKNEIYSTEKYTRANNAADQERLLKRDKLTNDN